LSDRHDKLIFCDADFQSARYLPVDDDRGALCGV